MSSKTDKKIRKEYKKAISIIASADIISEAEKLNMKLKIYKKSFIITFILLILSLILRIK